MGFNLADVLKDVSDSDTGREQIEYIKLDLIDEDPNNFYQLTDIPNLADNISLCGLQQPIRVRRHPEAAGRYMIVSGHRRRAAVELLAKDDPERWQNVACIVETSTGSAALQQLKVIYGNSSTRIMTSAEINEQAVQVEKLLYQLKEEGHEFPGRMRDHVAQVVQVSKSKLARLKVIRDNLSPSWFRRFQNNELKESTAYALAQIKPEYQVVMFNALEKSGRLSWLYESDISKYVQRLEKIDALTCKKTGEHCENAARKMSQAVQLFTYQICSCNKCCSKCPDLISCENACPKLADKVKKLKEDARYAKRQEKAAQAEKDRPQIEQIQNLWLRFGYLRDRAGKTVKEVCDAADIYYHKDDDKKYASFEDGTAKITTSTKLPFNYSCYLSDVQRYIALADLFGCSIDYMLCRTDVKEMAQPGGAVSESGTTWQTGVPTEEGTYLLRLSFGKHFDDQYEKWIWDGRRWHDGAMLYDPDTDGEILGWIPMPKEE